MAPLVSVIIPTHDRRALLEQAVRSVLEQVGPPLELVVVDDGSGDDTVAFLAALADARVRVVRLAHTGNVARVRNAGVAVAAGRWLAFLDDDDLWLPDKLRLQLEAMAAEGVRWSYTAFEHVDGEGRFLPPRAGVWRPLSGWIVRDVLTGHASTAISSLVVERALFQSVGGFDEDPALNLREDTELVLRLARAAPVVAVDRVLTRIRQHPGRTTEGQAENFRRSARVYDRFLASNPPPELRRIARRQRASHLAEAAARLVGERQFLAGTRCLARAALDGRGLRGLASAAARGLRWSALPRSGR